MPSYRVIHLTPRPVRKYFYYVHIIKLKRRKNNLLRKITHFKVTFLFLFFCELTLPRPSTHHGGLRNRPTLSFQPSFLFCSFCFNSSFFPINLEIFSSDFQYFYNTSIFLNPSLFFTYEVKKREGYHMMMICAYARELYRRNTRTF